MKIIHIPFCFHPDPVGGTEVYVEALARHLQELGTEVLVARADGHRAMETRGHVTAVWDNGRGRLSELARLASQRPDALLLRCYWGAVRRRLIG